MLYQIKIELLKSRTFELYEPVKNFLTVVLKELTLSKPTEKDLSKIGGRRNFKNNIILIRP